MGRVGNYAAILVGSWLAAAAVTSAQAADPAAGPIWGFLHIPAKRFNPGFRSPEEGGSRQQVDQKQRSCVEKELVQLKFQAPERSVDGLEIEPARIKLVAEPVEHLLVPLCA